MDKLSLDYLFQPQSIAVAGVSTDLVRFSEGQRYLRTLMECGFKGKIYAVNPSGGEVFGLKLYPSIKDVPDRVDYVISAVPARYTTQLMTDCAAKGVKAVQLYTAGFSETGDEEGKQLESEIVRLARQSGIRVIGPNCVGLYCPRTGLSFSLDFPRQSGPVGLIAQSGGQPTYCIREAARRGIYFSKVIGYGNASDLNESDFLEYLTYDPETKIIAAYIEGVKDAPRFIKTLKRATRAKPTIIFKGGTTDVGTKVTASHTGAMTSAYGIWESVLRQAGAIQVHSVDEMVDLFLLFSLMSPTTGRKIAIIGAGGAASVEAADDCYNAGLVMPTLPAHIMQKLESIHTIKAGRIFGNPLDINFPTAEIILNSVKTIADCKQIDLLLIHMGFDSWGLSNEIDRKNMLAPYVQSIFNLKKLINKPLVVVLHSLVTDEAKQFTTEAYMRLRKAGFPMYTSIRQAAKAINKFIQYHEWRQKKKASQWPTDN